MLPTDANKLTSTKLRELLPDFVDAEYPTFVAFLRSYYEWMEQAAQPIGFANRALSYSDIDSTLEEFVRHFRSTFLVNVPTAAAVDPARLATYIRELYRAKGSPTITRFKSCPSRVIATSSTRTSGDSCAL